MAGTKHVIIIGGGFCGTITAVNLVKAAKSALKITILNSGAPMGKGIAFSPYSSGHLLNVAAGNMSAVAGEPDHLVNWVKQKEEYREYEIDLLSKTFLPRNLYGEYLDSVWKEAMDSKPSFVEVIEINGKANDLEIADNKVKVILETKSTLIADYAVLATGNTLPANPHIKNMDYYSSHTYFRNPWSIDTVKKIPAGKDVLIIGNGLTMVDTVIGLTEQGFKGKIHSLSTHGFGVLSHRHLGLTYNGLINELKEPYIISTVAPLLHKHIKKVRKLGLSAGPVIDSLRPYSQKIWQASSLDDKKKFMKHFRHLWGVARHRLPIHIYDFIQDLKLDGKLLVHEGKLLDITESDLASGETVNVTFYNKRDKVHQILHVARVINCTGPETRIFKSQNPLLKTLAEKGTISCDPLELGINANLETYQIIDAKGNIVPQLFTLGSNLKGLLWETIAVPELRVQCKEVAEVLLKM